MIVKIVPIKRLPKGLDFFDYTVPAELEDKVKVGQLVEVPLRKSNIFGLILSIKNEIGPDLKELGQIYLEDPLVEIQHLNFLYKISQLYGVSLPTIVKMSLLPIQKTKIKKIKLKQFKTVEARTTPIQYHLYKNNRQHNEVLKKVIFGTTLILIPELYLIDEVRQLLPIELQQKAVVWQSGLSVKKQFERWVQIRNKEKTIIIGTRGAALLPIPDLKTIIVDYEHYDNHKHWDQAPRFHVKDVVDIKASLAGASITYTSHSPSLDSYYNIHKGNFTSICYPEAKARNLAENNNSKSEEFSTLLSMTPVDSSVEVIDLADERRAGRYSVLAEKLKDVIATAENDVFVFINRLGFSRTVICGKCGFITKCSSCQIPMVYHQNINRLSCHYCKIYQKLSTTCSNCNSNMIELKGAGTEFIESGIRDMLGEKNTHDILRIDSEIGGDLPYGDKPRIIVGTQMAMRHVRWNKTESIIFLSIDQQLSIPEYRASEKVWQTIQNAIFKKNTSSKLYIQTYNKNHLVFRSLVEPDRFYRAELNSRKSLLYPPYVKLARYFYGNRDAAVTKKQVDLLHNQLKISLTNQEKLPKISTENIQKNESEIRPGWISQPIEMHPKFYRNSYWFEILVRLPTKDWERYLAYINKGLPNGWKIDPNPISILNP